MGSVVHGASGKFLIDSYLGFDVGTCFLFRGVQQDAHINLCFVAKVGNSELPRKFSF